MPPTPQKKALLQGKPWGFDTRLQISRENKPATENPTAHACPAAPSTAEHRCSGGSGRILRDRVGPPWSWRDERHGGPSSSPARDAVAREQGGTGQRAAKHS